MYTTMLAAVLAAPPLPQNLLILADPAGTSLTQQVVQRALLQEALVGGTRHVLTHAPLPQATQRACALRQRGSIQLQEARALLQTLRPEEAAAAAAMARQKLQRTATLTGDVTALVDALALEAAAHLHAGTRAAAQRVLLQLLVLRPDWTPDPSLYNPEMQRAVGRVRRHLQKLPRRTLRIAPGHPQTAVFVDGALVGLGEVATCVVADQPHYIYTLSATGQGEGDCVVARAAPSEEPEKPFIVQLEPLAPSPHPDATARYHSVFAASATREGFVEPDLPVLAGAGVVEIWVVTATPTEVGLVRFDLQSGRRHTSTTLAPPGHMGAAKHAAQTLLLGQAEAEARAAAQHAEVAAEKKTAAASNEAGGRFLG